MIPISAPQNAVVTGVDAYGTSALTHRAFPQPPDILKFGTRDLSTPLVHRLSADCFILPVQDEDGLTLSLPETYGAASNTGKEQVLPIFQLEC